MIKKPEGILSSELQEALLKNQGVVGNTFRLMCQGIDKASEIVEKGPAANIGVVYNVKATIKSILEAEIPTSPSRAKASGRFVGGLLKANPDFSPLTREYLIYLRDELDDFASDESANQIENLEIEKVSLALEKTLESQSGVYVYTFPTYFKNPIKSDPERFWLKVGRTEQVVEMRIANQTRQTAMPEDPWILRVYQSDQINTNELEQKIHKILISAGHSRTEARHGGKEWFATNLEFLDEVANALSLKIMKNDF